MIDRGKGSVLGVQVSMVDYESAVRDIIRAAEHRRPYAVTALAVHGVMTGATDDEHRFRLNHFDLVVPDGQPVRWVLNWLHQAALPDRVYGPTLMLKVCEAAAQQGLPIFLYGSTTAVLDDLQRQLRARFPALTIAGTRPSAFRKLSPAEVRGVQEEILHSGAALAFVGLGCPRQEIWVHEHRDALSMPLLAVGAAFDFHAGTLPQAPAALQATGFEWAFRLLHEPRRLWRRYLLLNPVFVTLVALQALGIRNFANRGLRPKEDVRFG